MKEDIPADVPAPPTKPLSILDLMLIVAGVGLVLPFSAATFRPTLLAARADTSLIDRVHYAAESVISVIQGLAVGVLLCIIRRRFAKAGPLVMQPGHALLLLPLPFYLIMGPTRWVVQFFQDRGVDLLRFGIVDWLHGIIEACAIVVMVVLAISFRRFPHATLYRAALIIAIVEWCEGLLITFPFLRRAWFRWAFVRPWYFAPWLEATEGVLQMSLTLFAVIGDLQARTPRDWMHCAGAALWGAHCAARLCQTIATLAALYSL